MFKYFFWIVWFIFIVLILLSVTRINQFWYQSLIQFFNSGFKNINILISSNFCRFILANIRYMHLFYPIKFLKYNLFHATTYYKISNLYTIIIFNTMIRLFIKMCANNELFICGKIEIDLFFFIANIYL